MEDAAFLRYRLWVAAEFHATQAGYGFAADCAAHVRSLIDDGVGVLQAGNHLGDAGRVRLAQSKLLVFVDQMIVEGPIGPDRLLHEWTFDAARRVLCPLWPFC